MGNFTGIGKLPSELTEKTSLSETDIVITGSAAQRTTWKNVFEKISFSGLATTAKNIIGAINELNTKIDLSQSNISISGADTPLTVTKVGRVVTAEFYATTTENIKGWNRLGTIANKYCPAKTLYVNAISNNTTTGIYINASGVFEFTTDIPKGASVGFCVTYISAT